MTVLYIGVVVAALVVVRWLIETIKRDGELQAKLDQMGKDAEIAAKRAEEMLKEKTVEDTARDLDSGRFYLVGVPDDIRRLPAARDLQCGDTAACG
jgi:hypothetical protein